MSILEPKRFWKSAEVVACDGGFTVALDGRAVRTPAKTAFSVPTEILARHIADEWMAQDEKIDPATMPYTRTANAAIDKVAPQFKEVAGLIAAYGENDLLCYRAESPRELADRQARLWDPLLAWATSAFGVNLQIGTGVMHIEQAPNDMQTLAKLVTDMTAYQLAAFHDLVSLSGSLILGLAAARNHADWQVLWDLSRVDETWQEEQWGHDDEAHAAAQIKRASFEHAQKFYAACG